MSIASNQYAAKVFSEHPVAIWPLDDNAHYLSLIQDEERDLTEWTLINCSATLDPELPDLPSPFSSNADYFGIVGDYEELGEGGGTIELKSNPIFMFDSLSQDLRNFSINFYLYQKSVYVTSYEFGFRYFDTFLGTYKEVLKQSSPSPVAKWIRFNDTFDVPEFDEDTCEIILRINVSPGGRDGDYNFIMNALSVGQWSESFSAQTLGSTPIEIPSSTGLPSVYGLESEQYGPLSDNAYYIVENGKLLARNNGVPLVFGSENCVQLNASSSDLPSFVFPSKGFLSEDGRYKTQTLEFWMKIRPNTLVDRRIFGPLNSDYGVYVSEGFIALSIGDNFQTHSVYEWYRPMLVHIVYNQTNCQMYINGEQVAEIEIDRKNLVFESENDWLAFFDYEDIDMFEIDCISIFPYPVPLQVARRRFVWGQGTGSQQSIDNSFKGTPTAFSFPNSEYSSSVIYPDKERWDAAYSNNLSTTKTSLTVPEYSLPEIFLSGRDKLLWYSDNKTINNSESISGNDPKFITFRPNQKIRTNLITNPSFEIDTTGWQTTNATITRITTESFVGNACVSVSKNANVNGRIRTVSTAGNRIPVTAGQTYLFSAYVKVPSLQPSCSLRIRTTEWRSNGTRNSDQVSPATIVSDSDGWVRLSFFDTPTAGSLPTVSMTFEIEETTNNARTYLVDAAMVEQTTQLLPYFDGSYASPEAKAISINWLGTTNNSASQLSTWSTDGFNWDEKCYMEFSTANIASAPISAMFGIFELKDNINQDRPLIHIVSGLNGKRFEININSYTLSYVFEGEELYSVDTTGQDHIVAGIHVPTIIQRFGSELSSFFSSYDSLQMYIGGAPDTSSKTYETFEGKIYKVSFSDSSNYDEVSQYFDEDGIVFYDEDELFIGHYSTYTVSPFLKYGKFYLDISISASWEEYYPLSVFADYAIDSQGTEFYGLDYLQFNIGYPSYIEKNQISFVGPAWKNYADFQETFSYPIQKSYEILDNELITGYDNYDDLENNVITQVVIDTSKSSVDIFATFQLISEGADEPLKNFAFTKELTQSMTVDAPAENTTANKFKAFRTKFRVVDGTIIYPPKNIKFEDVALTLHFSINKDSILSHPLTIRDMLIASQTLNMAQPNPIGTKFGKKIYPYIKRGIYLDYKSKNPVLIYNKSNPYLYLTENSGIKVLTYNEINNEYLASVPVNESLQRNLYVGAAQMFIKFDVDDIIATPFPLFEIQHKSSTIEFVGDIDSSTLRTKIIARDKFSKQIYNNILFYQNGIETSGVFLEKDHWVSLGMVFLDPLDFSLFNGAINLFGGAHFDNISYYLSEGLNEIASIIPRTWQNVLTSDGINNFDWQYWYDENGSSVIKKWKNVYVFAEEQQYSLDASDIYKTYLGTNIDVVDDGGGISVLNDDFYVLSNVLWSSTVGKPA